MIVAPSVRYVVLTWADIVPGIGVAVAVYVVLWWFLRGRK